MQEAHIDSQFSDNLKQKIAVLIPCYNEENRIAPIILLCHNFASSVYVCDDGSTDGTAQIAKKMGAIVIRHEGNLGYGAALRTLFSAVCDSNAKVAVTIDGDGQHDPNYIQYLVKPILDNEADMVIGSRFALGNHKAKMPAYRKTGVRIITAVANSGNSHETTDCQSGLRAYAVRFVKKIVPSEVGMAASTEIFMKARSQKMRIKEIPVDIRYYSDSSTHNPFVHGLEVLLAIPKQYSLKHPLLFYGLPGVISILISALFWTLLINSFTTTKLIETNFAILALGFTMVGFVLVATAMILWTIINVVRST
jgi:glycosyltransferase involved in cell wall biosynthesis